MFLFISSLPVSRLVTLKLSPFTAVACDLLTCSSMMEV